MTAGIVGLLIASPNAAPLLTGPGPGAGEYSRDAGTPLSLRRAGRS